jgi:hypothetical protein
MKSLAFLSGTWEGEGWIQQGPGGRESYAQREVVEWRLDGGILLVEGTGREPGEGGRIVHHAFAVISAEPTGEYRVMAYLTDGRVADARGKMVDQGGFEWGFDNPAGKVRYTIRLNEAGEWVETGEFSRDGTAWMPFLEMHLKKSG